MSEDLEASVGASSDVSNGTDMLSESSVEEKKIVPSVVHPVKSYDNAFWMHSRAARHVRIICEYLEVQDRLRRANVLFTFLVFGSARSLSTIAWKEKFDTCSRLHQEATLAGNCIEIENQRKELSRLQRLSKLCKYWDKTYELSKMLATWSQTEEARVALAKILEEMPSPVGPIIPEPRSSENSLKEESRKSSVAVCTGGGYGFMEAANKGAADAIGGRSMGMGISLPFEAGLNPFVDQDLAFEFHYFFTRKFWMVYTALGVIATPGGLGTLDELMEVLTLKQSGKFKRDIPVVLLGKDFWEACLNFEVLLDYGTISEKDKEQLFMTDNPLEAFEYIRSHILNDKLILGDSHIHKSRRRRHALDD